MVTANLTVCSTTWTLSPLLEDLSQYSCCLSRPSLHHLLSKIFSSPLSFYLESSLVPLSLSSSSFPLFLLSLPWSITSCSCYNSLFILLYYLILFFYWFSFSLAPVDTKEKNSCSQFGFISLNFKWNGNSLKDFRILSQEAMRIFFTYMSSRFVMLLIELTALLPAS